MAGFDDCIQGALPYLAIETIEATNGTDWWWGYVLLDDSLNEVDITTGFTASATIRDADGVEAVAPTVTRPSGGQVMCKVANADSAGVGKDTYYHEVTVTRTADDATVILVGAGDSKFIVKQKVG